MKRVKYLGGQAVSYPGSKRQMLLEKFTGKTGTVIEGAAVWEGYSAVKFDTTIDNVSKWYIKKEYLEVLSDEDEVPFIFPVDESAGRFMHSTVCSSVQTAIDGTGTYLRKGVLDDLIDMKNEAILNLAVSRQRIAAEQYELHMATTALYEAGRWSCDRPVDEAKLWTRVRDALKRVPGTSPKPVALNSSYRIRSISVQPGDYLSVEVTMLHSVKPLTKPEADEIHKGLPVVQLWIDARRSNDIIGILNDALKGYMIDLEQGAPLGTNKIGVRARSERGEAA